MRVLSNAPKVPMPMHLTRGVVPKNLERSKVASKAPSFSMRIGRGDVIPLDEEAFAPLHGTEWARNGHAKGRSIPHASETAEFNTIITRTECNTLNSGSAVQNRLPINDRRLPRVARLSKMRQTQDDTRAHCCLRVGKGLLQYQKLLSMPQLHLSRLSKLKVQVHGSIGCRNRQGPFPCHCVEVTRFHEVGQRCARFKPGT